MEKDVRSEDQEEFLRELMEVYCLAEANPCGMKAEMFRTFKNTIMGLLGKEIRKGLSRDKLAQFLGVSYRTMERYQKKFPDFPKPMNNGDKTISYDPVEAVMFKKAHPEIGES